MTLGSAVGPRTNLTSGLERAVEQYLEARGDSVALLQKVLEGQQAILDQLAVATAALASAAEAISRVPALPAPVVNVETPAPSVSVEAPNVTFDVPPAQVEILQAPAAPQQRVVKTVERDASGLITRITEEPA